MTFRGLLLVACVSGSSLAEPLRVSTQGRWFVDAVGRVRIFHGFNDVGSSKGTGHTPGGEQYLPKTIMNQSNLDALSELGFNVLRLPMMWAAVAPTEDSFDEAYLSTMAGVIDELAARDMYGFLDMHQDVLSSLLGSYDGAPQWVVNRTQPRQPYPWPLKAPLSKWAYGYWAEATGQAFQDIFDNSHGGLDAWAAFWRKVASTFVSKRAVLGYELMNEPWVGDVFSHPTLVLPGEAGRRNLMPAYDKLASAIHEVDNETIIMFEPMQGVVLAGNGELGTGFNSVPGGQAYANRSCLSWHYYCVFLNSDYVNSSTPMTPLSREACHRATGPHLFRSAVRNAEKIQAATLITEFGALVPDAEFPEGQGSEEIEWVLDEADATLQGWTYWDIIGLFDRQTGGYRPKAMDLFVRPYASAIAGVPTKMTYTRKTGVFELTFEPNSDISEPTEVMAPALRYPNGYDVHLTDGLKKVPCSRENMVCVTAVKSASGKAASITLIPKAHLLSVSV